MLLGWLKQGKADHHLLGLDMGSGSIKLIEIHSTPSSYYIENFASAPLPAGAVVKNEVKDPTAISYVLKNLLIQENIVNKHVAVAVPRSSVTVKTTTVDSRLTASEIESRAWVEANRQFPELIGGIYLDYQILGTTANDPNQLDLMLVACRKEHIDPYLEVLKQSNLIAEWVDVSCYALRRAIPLVISHDPESETIALLNLDFATSSLVVVQKNQMIYAHDHSFDGERLMTKAKEYLSAINPEIRVLQERAVSLEAGNAQLGSPDVSSMVTGSDANEAPVQTNAPNSRSRAVEDPAYLEILRENLIAQLRHFMHFFYSSRPNTTIQKLVLSGDCVALPRLALFVQQEIGIATLTANPFSDIDTAPHVNQNELKKAGPSLMLASGLSLYSDDHINLLPWREQARQGKKKQLMVTLVSFMMLALVMALMIHFYLGSLITNQVNLNSYLQSQITLEQATLTNLQKKKQGEIELKKKILFLVGLQTKSNNSVKMLDELVRIIPGTVALTRLVSDSETVVLEGLAQSDLDITLFMQKISESKVFATPILTEINTKNVGKEGEKSFQLKVKQR